MNFTPKDNVEVVIFIVIIIAMRLAVGSMNRARIRGYIQARGGHIIKIKWSPLGPGWMAAKYEAIYHIIYMDARGAEREAYCKTGFWSAVYITEDKVTKYPKPRYKPKSAETKSLEDENARLRKELEELKRKPSNDR